jgi:diguanylate cyclase (GGDEF)-like protein
MIATLVETLNLGSEATAAGPDRDSVRLFIEDERRPTLELTLDALGYVTKSELSTAREHDDVATLVSASFDVDLEVCRKQATRSKVIVIDAPDTLSFRLAAARAGVTAVLSSPLDSSELAAWLSDIRHQSPSFHIHNVLVVDDDPLVGEACALALETSGMVARVVTDAQTALQEIDRLRPDLLLLDLHMPTISGMELARIIRQSRAMLSLPIVFLSAERDALAQSEAREIGGDDFIAKPLKLEQLGRIVRMRADRALRLRSIMERDGLTGLLNHARFKERLELEMERSRRTGTPLTLCMVDIDHFKRVNDTFGHQAGDEVIRNLAQILSGGLRKTDVVARYGGEEFALLLLDTPLVAAEIVIDRLRRSFSEFRLRSADREVSTTFSAGVANAATSNDGRAALELADTMLYRAKHAGRNCVVVAD